MIEEVASLANSKGFFQKIRTACSIILCQRSFNVYGTYLAIEEFNGGRQGIIVLLEGKEKWGWCGFGKVLCFLLAPYLTVKQLPPTFHGDPCIGKSVSQTVLAVKTTCTSALGATSSSDTTSMAVGKLSESKIVAVVHTLSTGTQFPPATSSGAMSSSNAASMADGQNRTKPALDMRTNQRTHFGTSKKDVAYCSDSHSRPHHTSAGSSVSIETKEVGKWGGSKKAGAVFFPAWKILKSLKDSCRPLLGSNLRIIVDGQGVRHVSWKTPHVTQIWRKKAHGFDKRDSEVSSGTNRGLSMGQADLWVPPDFRPGSSSLGQPSALGFFPESFPHQSSPSILEQAPPPSDAGRKSMNPSLS
jgi:hypothetical protein